MRFSLPILLAASGLLCACVGGSNGVGNNTTATNATPPPPIANQMAVVVDAGPVAGTTAVNHPYVTVKVCAAGTKTCTSIDHVLLDTGSWGLRLFRSLLTAGAVTLAAETDPANPAQTIAECATFAGGTTWGPVALADVTLAGETAAKLPVQVIDDSAGATPPPAACGSGGFFISGVSATFPANGILGVGVFAQDCGAACAPGATAPQTTYYGCTAAGACAAEYVPLTGQVTNPVSLFTADNNGLIVDLPNLVNANGDTSVQGQLIFGLGTQTDNALPTALTVLGTDASGDFTATYNGATTPLPSLIDSGADDYGFDDQTIPPCSSQTTIWGGYYCPTLHPQPLFAVNTSAATTTAVVPGGSNTVNFAIADPSLSFVANASAFSGLGGGRGSARFTWGMPFFYGRKIYIGIDKRAAGSVTGPFYAY